MAGTKFIQALHNLKIAKEIFADIQREYPESKGARLAKNYEGKIDWFFKDLVSNPGFDKVTIEGIKAEWNSDVFVVPAIMEKISALRPDQRDNLENVVDLILKGESIDICLKA